jgi:NDP-sugar pyrophosphorylase family protein
MSLLHPETLFDLNQYRHAPLFTDCKYAWEPLAAIKSYCATVVGNSTDRALPAGVQLINPETIYLGEGTVLEPGCWIQGPCILGRHCQVRQGAYIRGHFIAGDGCVIGHTTEVKNAIFLNGVHAAHFAYVGDSILGNAVNLGAGMKCANLKFDGSAISITWQGKRYATGLRKLGAMIGDRAQIGCNAVTNPGTIVGQGAQWYPCVNSGGVIPAGARVTPSSPAVIIAH